MYTFQLPRLLRQALCVAALFSAAQAHANVYHVQLDTGTLAGNGWIDLQFNPGMDTAPEAKAALSGFTGALNIASPAQVAGDVSGVLPGAVIFGNSGAFNDLLQAIYFGGVFNFDIDFSGMFFTTISDVGTTFAVGLYADDQVTALGNYDAGGSLLRFDLLPANSDAAGNVALTVTDNRIVTVTAAQVPEPSSVLLLLSGLAGLVLLRKKRSLFSV